MVQMRRLISKQIHVQITILNLVPEFRMPIAHDLDFFLCFSIQAVVSPTAIPIPVLPTNVDHAESCHCHRNASRTQVERISLAEVGGIFRQVRPNTDRKYLYFACYVTIGSGRLTQ